MDFVGMCVVIFFFKQKTAYEMRISDWSSDVCSSDLLIRIFAFTLTGVAASVAGVLDTARTAGVPTSSAVATTLTFTVLAGIVVGGTSILGGEGAVWRTVVGVLFIALVYNGFNLLRVDPLFQQVALGTILLLAVGIDAKSGERRVGKECV